MRGAIRDFAEGLLDGAAILVAGTALLLAAGGGGAVWLSPPAGPRGAFHLAVAGALLLFLAARRARPEGGAGRGLRIAAAAALAALALCAARDAVGYYGLLSRGAIRSSFPVPLSAAVFAFLAAGVVSLLAPRPERPLSSGRAAAGLAGAGAGGLGLLLALLGTFGATDYRRPADCAIVLGAAVRPDGRASHALADRVASGVALYRDGLVGFLVMSGGVDRHGHSEPEVMRDLAVAAGVPAEAILLDEGGMDTRRSAEGCAVLMARRGLRTALVTSHWYHLARCREAFRRAGVPVRTVPAPMSRRLAREPLFLLRECAAFLAYLLPARGKSRTNDSESFFRAFTAASLRP